MRQKGSSRDSAGRVLAVFASRLYSSPPWGPPGQSAARWPLSHLSPEENTDLDPKFPTIKMPSDRARRRVSSVLHTSTQTVTATQVSCFLPLPAYAAFLRKPHS